MNDVGYRLVRALNDLSADNQADEIRILRKAMEDTLEDLQNTVCISFAQWNLFELYWLHINSSTIAFKEKLVLGEVMKLVKQQVNRKGGYGKIPTI